MSAPPAGDALDALAEALGSLARRDQPLGALTTYRVGGPAALVAEVGSEAELVEVARRRLAAAPGTEVLVLGRGSNLLVADRGFPGLVVRLAGAFGDLAIAGREVVAGAAVALPVLARRSAAAGLTGLEWAVGVPGSVGGAVRMNAGGHGADTARTLRRYRWVDLATARVHEAGAERAALGYRRSAVLATDVVTSATFVLERGDPEASAAAIAEIVRWRRANQPGGSNAGSVFVNPEGDSAGRLVDEAGLKGYRIGSAEVSRKHANFIVADDGGSAADVVALIEHVRQVVARRSGVELHTEVRMVGFRCGGGPGSAS